MSAQWWAVVGMVPLIAATLWWQRRGRSDPPTALPVHEAPSQLDPADLRRRGLLSIDGAEWLVVLFSSATCDGCRSVWRAASVLESPEVAVCEIEFAAHRDLHEHYRITGVPTLVIADASGLVRRSFLGTVSATHLWAAVAEVREPGSVPPGCGEN